LAPYNVFVAADIFGYVCWNLNDTDIGQKLEPIASAVDYLAPMLYPSGFQFGIPGYRNPVQNPYEIVYLSLKRAQERTKISPSAFAWLQAFKDYAFDRRQFNGRELRDQISAADKFGSQGGCSGTLVIIICSRPMPLKRTSGRPASALLPQTPEARKSLISDN